MLYKTLCVSNASIVTVNFHPEACLKNDFIIDPESVFDYTADLPVLTLEKDSGITYGHHLKADSRKERDIAMKTDSFELKHKRRLPRQKDYRIGIRQKASLGIKQRTFVQQQLKTATLNILRSIILPKYKRRKVFMAPLLYKATCRKL